MFILAKNLTQSITYLSSHGIAPNHPGRKRSNDTSHQLLISSKSAKALNRAKINSPSSKETCVAAVLRTKAEEHLQR